MTRFATDVISAVAQQRPDVVAVRAAFGEITFAELDAASDRIAAVLRSRGVVAEDRVALCARIGIPFVVAAIGVMKAGAAFVPLDPSYPVVRIRAMLTASSPRVVIHHDTLGEWPPLQGHALLGFNELTRETAALRELSPRAQVDAEAGAYVVFTSGSTGTPKGVLVSHRGLMNMIEQQIDVFGIVAGSRVLQFAPSSFDASISEFFTALCAGAELCIIEQPCDRQGTALLDLIERLHITTVTLPPSLLRALPARELPDLTTLVSAGEACTPDVIEKWQRPGRKLINAYGPSEVTVCTTMKITRTPADATNIGTPLRGLDVYVLDDRLQRVPAGETGELYIAGVGLARGYLGQPRATAERFLPDPFGTDQGARMYRTGDRVRQLASGDLEFLGRVDAQMKVRGFRIEPGEIEAALRQAPGVRDVVVGTRRRTSGDAVLVAYIVADHRDAEMLRTYARRALADFMQPADYAFVDALPKTPAGKVDRDGVGKLARQARPTGIRAPRTDTERVVLGLYQELLEVAAVDPTRNFFDLGGDSILALRLLLRLELAFGRRVTMSTLFERPSAEALAEWIDRSRPAPGATQPASTSAPGWLQLRTGNGTPFWLVPPVHGNPLCYLEFARRSPPGRPFYALQIPGLDDDREPINDFRTLATALVGQLRAVQPTGPYYLGGWSLGGALAFAMALQLQEAGEEVPGLLLIAATPPSEDHLSVARLNMGEYEHWKIAYMYATQMANSIGQPLDIHAEFEAFKGLSEDEAARLLAARLAKLGTVPADASVVEIRRWVRVFRASLIGFHHFTATTKYRGTAFAPKPGNSNPLHKSRMIARPLPAGDWTGLVENLEVQAIDGDPLNVMYRPWVDDVIDVVARWLDRVAPA